MLSAIQQTAAWLKFQNQLPNRKGWEVFGTYVYKLQFKPSWNFLYVPGYHERLSEKVLNELEKLARQENCFFIHYEPYARLESPSIQPPKTYRSPFSYILPTTRVIDLSLSPDELYQQLHSKGRYYLKKAQKNNLEIKPETSVDNFYQLLKETTNRNNFSGNPKSYYKHMLHSLGENCRIWTAFQGSKPVASVMITFAKQTATYYYGASSSKYNKLFAPYLLQWHSILKAKEAGYTHYDLMGIAPIDHKDNHKLAGVSQFKRKFGGQIVELQPAVDRPISWWKYLIFRTYKAIKG